MAFTLTDPRAQSQYRQGMGLGGGIGDQIVRNMESQQFQQALGNITPNMPINDVLRQLAMARVSQENVNNYLSPQVQQRLGQERAKTGFGQVQQMLETAAKNGVPPNEIETLLGVLTAMSDVPQFGSSAGEITTAVLNAAKRKARGDLPTGKEGQAGQGGQVQGGMGQIGTGQGQNQVMGQGQGQKFPGFMQTNPYQAENVPRGTDIRSNPIVPPSGKALTPQNWASLVGEYSRAVPGSTQQEAFDYADRFSNLSQKQQENEWKLLEQGRAYQSDLLSADQRSNTAAEKFIARDMPNAPGWYKDALPTLMRFDDKGGTMEQRYGRAKEMLDTEVTRMNKLSTKKDKRPIAAGLRTEKYADWVKGIKNNVAVTMKPIAEVENKMPNFGWKIRNEIRKVLAAPEEIDASTGQVDRPGLGAAEIEYAITPLQAKPKKLLDSLGEAPKAPREFDQPFLGGEIGEGQLNAQTNRKKTDLYNEQLAKHKTKMVDTIIKLSKENVSPLIIKDYLLHKNYPENIIVDAFRDANENLQYSPEYQEQLQDVSQRYEFSLEDIFLGQPRQRSVYDIWSGRR